MDFLRRHFFDLACAPAVVWLQWVLAGRVQGLLATRWHGLVRAGTYLSAGLIVFAFTVSLPWVSQWLPFSAPVEWMKAAGLVWAICTAGAWGIDLLWRGAVRVAKPLSLPGGHDPQRRKLLLAGRTAAMSMPAVMLGYGSFIERNHFRLVETRVEIPGLHKDLAGLRIVQLSDLHFGPFFGPRDLRYAIDMANATRAHVALVTGDLITGHSDPLDECLGLLRSLRGEAGVLGCMGNHEIVADCEDYAEWKGRAAGIRFLRDKAETLPFGSAELNIAGVDYQPKGKPYLRHSAPLVREGKLNLLLSHNPDVFPVAAAQNWDLTLAGHTHGGQITVEILGVNANVARFYTPYVYGHYKKDGRQIYVSRGLGTVGIPSRFGAPPEVSLLTLCAT